MIEDGCFVGASVKVSPLLRRGGGGWVEPDDFWCKKLRNDQNFFGLDFGFFYLSLVKSRSRILSPLVGLSTTWSKLC